MRRTLSPLSSSVRTSSVPTVGLLALAVVFATGCGDLTQPNYNQIRKDPDVKVATASVPGAAAPGANQPAAQAQGGAVRAPQADKAPGATQPAATGAQPAMQKMAPVKPVVAPQPQMPSGPSCGG